MSTLLGGIIDAAAGGLGGYVFGRIRGAMLKPKPKPDPTPICLCGHAISFHEDKIGRCINVDLEKLKTEVAALDGNGDVIFDDDDYPVFNVTESFVEKPCGCLHYVGPDPIPTMIAL